MYAASAASLAKGLLGVYYVSQQLSGTIMYVREYHVCTNEYITAPVFDAKCIRTFS